MLPLNYFTYTNHAAKHKKPYLVNITVYLETPQKQKTKKTEAIKYKAFSGHSEHGSQGFYSLLRPYAIILRSLSGNSTSFFALSLWSLNGIF